MDLDQVTVLESILRGYCEADPTDIRNYALAALLRPAHKQLSEVIWTGEHMESSIGRVIFESEKPDEPTKAVTKRRGSTVNRGKPCPAMGPVVALLADGISAADAAEELGMPVMAVRTAKGLFKAHIASVSTLEPGDSRRAYLQKHFGWPGGNGFDSTIGAQVAAKGGMK